MVLGEKAVKALRHAELPREVMDAVDSAPRYAEGRGLRLEVRFKKDIDSIRKLARAKMANRVARRRGIRFGPTPSRTGG
jgi:hypothetical protein